MVDLQKKIEIFKELIEKRRIDYNKAVVELETLVENGELGYLVSTYSELANNEKFGECVDNKNEEDVKSFVEYVKLSLVSLEDYNNQVLNIKRIEYYKNKIFGKIFQDKIIDCRDKIFGNFLKLQLTCDWNWVLLGKANDTLIKLENELGEQQRRERVTADNQRQAFTVAVLEGKCEVYKNNSDYYNKCMENGRGGKKSSKKRKASKKNRRKTVAKRSGKRKHSSRKNI